MIYVLAAAASLSGARSGEQQEQRISCSRYHIHLQRTSGCTQQGPGDVGPVYFCDEHTVARL